MIQKLYAHDNDPRVMQRIIDLLNDGGIIIYPTDSVYAIGCHALKSNAVERICEIKGVDPQKNHFSIICYDLSEVSKYARMDNKAFKLMKRNLPGPFTFILEGSNKLPKIFRNRKTIGIRMPDNPVISEISKLLGVPIMTTSLPVSDDEDPEYETTPELIDERFGEKVDLVIDGGIGATLPSTVVDCTTGDFSIVRQGKGVLKE